MLPGHYNSVRGRSENDPPRSDIQNNNRSGCSSPSKYSTHTVDTSTTYYTAQTSQSLERSQTPSPTMENVRPGLTNAVGQESSAPEAGGKPLLPTIATISDQLHFFYLDPYLVHYSVVHKDRDPEFKDIWLTYVGLEGNKHVPALPAAYRAESAAHRAVYIRGVPDDYRLGEFQEIFRAYGTVSKCPCIIDTVSEETFRWVIMENKIEAERVQKSIHRQQFQDFKLIASIALPPGRSLTIHTHQSAVEESYVMPEDCVFPEAAQGATIHGHPEPPTNAQLIDPIENEAPFPLEFMPHAPEGWVDPELPPATTSKRPADPAIIPPKTFDTIATPLLLKPLSYGAEVRAGRRKPKPIPAPLVFKSEDAVFDAFPEPKRQAAPANNTLDRFATLGILAPKGHAPTSMTDNVIGSRKQGTKYAEASSPTPKPRSGYLAMNQDGPSSIHPPPNDSLLVARLREVGSKSRSSQKASLETVDCVTENSAAGTESSSGPIIQPIAPVALPPQSHPIAVPVSVSAPTISSSLTTPVDTEFRTQVSSWANVAGTAAPNSRIIELHPTARKPITGPRLNPVGRIPAVVSAHDSEPITEQMRVVFLLDLPNTLTVENVSAAVKEGPIRSIHFGMDEEKGKRYAAVVFQYASDAAAFTAVLLKERAESKPDRFRFIVDVARGEEPFYVDDVLRAMGPPTYASRRLTLVKASFFFMFGERQIRQFCEKIVGENALQLIWIYNGGNATIVFADVGSAMMVKAGFDQAAASAGQPDGQPMVWSGLMTTYSKDPCVVPLELKTAMHD